MSHSPTTPPDNVLAHIDQAYLLTTRADRVEQSLQCTWIYRRGVDLAGLRRMNENLAYGLLGRRIERSPIPFGRHRWVANHDVPPVDVAEPVHTRAELTAWLETRAEIPTDPEHGPSWHIGVLPVDGYGTAVTLLASHTIIDAGGLCLAVADAAKGITHDLGYPLPRSRSRRQALLADARQFVRDLPGIAAAIATAVKLGVRTAREARGRKGSAALSPNPATDPTPVVYAATAWVDVDEWDTRADALGGTSNSLFAGFAVQLARKAGRVNPINREVFLSYPVSERTDGDTRANALTAVEFSVDPGDVTTDLRAMRAKTKEALTEGLGTLEEVRSALTLIPFVPEASVRKAHQTASYYANLPVCCSNLGDIEPTTACADGTEADIVSIRLIKQALPALSPEIMFGELYLMSGRIRGKLFLTIRFHVPERVSSAAGLRDLVTETLNDFALTGTVE